MNLFLMDMIIFDFGGVFIDWNFCYLFWKFFEEEQEMEYFLEYVCIGDWNEQQDGGCLFVEVIVLKMVEFLEYKFQIKVFFECWVEMFGGLIGGMVAFLE